MEPCLQADVREWDSSLRGGLGLTQEQGISFPKIGGNTGPREAKVQVSSDCGGLERVLSSGGLFQLSGEKRWDVRWGQRSVVVGSPAAMTDRPTL